MIKSNQTNSKIIIQVKNSTDEFNSRFIRTEKRNGKQEDDTE